MPGGTSERCEEGNGTAVTRRRTRGEGDLGFVSERGHGSGPITQAPREFLVVLVRSKRQEPQRSWSVSPRSTHCYGFRTTEVQPVFMASVMKTAKGTSGRGAAVRGRERAQRSSVVYTGGHPGTTAGSREPRSQDRSTTLCRPEWGVVFRVCRTECRHLAVDRTRGRGGVSFRGARDQESNGPEVIRKAGLTSSLRRVSA